MSLAEEFSIRYAGLRQAYGTFTASDETREDGKASGKNITISPIPFLFCIKTLQILLLLNLQSLL